MPKQKSKSGAKKRFKLTNRGKVKRKYAFASHILTSKTKKRKRKLRQTSLVNEADLRQVKRMINV